MQLTERLIGLDTATPDGLAQALEFVEGVLAGSGARVERHRLADRECIQATVGRGSPRIILHGHVDVVPGRDDQFIPTVRDGRLYGRGAYDMKGALAAMMLSLGDLVDLEDAEVTLIVVPDEEASTVGPNCTEMLVERGLRGDIVICGEPTDMHVGIQAKGVLMVRAVVEGIAAHGSTPWLGRSAILDGVDMYRAIHDLPFASESTDVFAHPSINLGRIHGGDAVNKVADRCVMDIDIRYLPGQDPAAVLKQLSGVGDWDLEVLMQREPAFVDAGHPLVAALIASASACEPQAESVGRDGASDAVAFLRVGVPAVEFGPCGAGHHGPSEYVDTVSLSAYRRALVTFAREVAATHSEVQ